MLDFLLGILPCHCHLRPKSYHDNIAAILRVQTTLQNVLTWTVARAWIAYIISYITSVEAKQSSVCMVERHEHHSVSFCSMASDHDEPRDLEQIVRDGLSTLVFGFGYRAGILDSFIKTQQPCSAEELAKLAGMKVR